MTTNNLTEQWKKGELPKGYYYAEDDGEELIIHIQGKNGSVMGDDFDLKATDWIKPITPVPSYEEWNKLQNSLEHEKMRATHYYKTLIEIEDENEKLEELLKECKNLINECIRGDYKNELCERIDEALK